MISLFNCLCLFFLLFFLGLSAIIVHKNLLFVLIGLEVIMNATSLLFVFISNYWHHIDGQIMFILSVTLSAVEASISLTILIQYFKNKDTLNINQFSEIIE